MPGTTVVIDADACLPEGAAAGLPLLAVPADAPRLVEGETVPRLRLEAEPAKAEPVAQACAAAAERVDAVLYIAAGDGYGSAPEAAPLAASAVAARSPGTRFEAHDSEATLMAYGWQALAAARAIVAGADVDGAREAAAAVRGAASMLAVLEHPELAGAGGASVPGTARLRAVVEMRGSEVTVLARPVRRDQALVALRDHFTTLAARPGGALHVAVLHAAAEAGALALATWVRRSLDPEELVVTPITRHAATRLGPRMIGVAWYQEP